MEKISYYIVETYNGKERRRVYAGYRNETVEDLLSKLAYYRAEYLDSKFHIEKEVTVTTTEELRF